MALKIINSFKSSLCKNLVGAKYTIGISNEVPKEIILLLFSKSYGK